MGNDIQLYQGNVALLPESLEVIQRTSALILCPIETEKGEVEQNEAPPTTNENDTDALGGIHI